MRFRTYKRRNTSRESGFHVSGKTTGSECKIVKSLFFEDKNKYASFKFFREKIDLVNLFNINKSILALGFYIFPEKTITANIKLTYTYQSKEISKNSEISFDTNRWNKIGIHDFVEIKSDNEVQNICVELNFKSTEYVAFHIYGFDMDIVNQVHFIDNEDAYVEFNKKTMLSVPEIYYLNSEKKLDEYLISPSIKAFQQGKTIVLKSCNRCARFLPINIEDERSTLAFSNHCASRAPCTHKSFSTYNIVTNDSPSIPQINENNQVQTYYGHQLECKACKKFFVNAPLNPMRTSTQHREDSLRRRAIEVLVDTLLENEWIYHKYRKQKHKEFDKHIWESFGKKCFNCGKEISIKEMDLDHTMPLAYLWPLDIHATCLCSSCNSKKSDLFPSEFYDDNKLELLSQITNLPMELISIKSINVNALEKLVQNIDWFFDDFLMHKDYQKIREGKKASDQIYNSIQKVIFASAIEIDLIKEYYTKTKRYPKSITLKH